MLKLTTFLIFLIFLWNGFAVAQDISLNGFFQGNYSVGLIGGSNPDGGDFKWAEEKLQLKISADRPPLYFFLKTDLSYDHIDDEEDIELREAYIDYLSENWDMRVGRQIITWGVGDLIFINDVFPKDYEAFFSGRPLEYLKKGVDGIKIGIYPSFASAEIVIIPFFEPDTYPLYPYSKRLWTYDPRPWLLESRKEIEPSTKIENTELALRIYRNILEFDVSLYFYRGFYRRPLLWPDILPSPLTTKIDFYHPKLSVYGASLQGKALNGIISLEGAFYDSRQDREGTYPPIPNQSTNFLVGYQRQVWEDFTAGLQYYAEFMHNHSEFETTRRILSPPCPPLKELQDLLTLRLTHLFMHQTLQFSFFSFWSLSDGDYMLIPEVKYNFSDHIWATLGANIFGGGEEWGGGGRSREWSRFGQLNTNDNIYSVIRYEF